MKKLLFILMAVLVEMSVLSCKSSHTTTSQVLEKHNSEKVVKKNSTTLSDLAKRIDATTIEDLEIVIEEYNEPKEGERQGSLKSKTTLKRKKDTQSKESTTEEKKDSTTTKEAQTDESDITSNSEVKEKKDTRVFKPIISISMIGSLAIGLFIYWRKKR